ncbi:MAG: EamA family transporter [Tatlockia sp.]|nr:EamA family transporter [Tatlockia sp.]
MPLPHLLLALLVVIIWGINFLFVKFALEEITPLFLCAARFILASVPAIFFIKMPAIPFKTVILYGLVMFALQFSFLFLGMHAGMTPGMASLIMQTQVFFSMFFAALILGEKTGIWQIWGALISFAGIGLVAMHFDATISFLGFICILAAAATWGLGNLIIRKNNKISMIALVVWGSFVASLPMLLISLLIEGPKALNTTLHQLTWQGAFSMAYIVYVSTWVGYGVWNWLLSRYAVGTVVPFTLLVPVVGILSSVLILGEIFQFWKLVACLLVISGLFINIFGSRLSANKIVRELSQ